MDVPTTSFAVVAVIVLAVPGFVFAGVRRWATGERASDRDVGLSIARGIVFAVALSALYAVALGPYLAEVVSISAQDAVSIRDPRLVGGLVLVPFAVSFLSQASFIEWPIRGAGPKWLRIPRSKVGYTAMPTAWDFAATVKQDSWIRVTRADGSRLAGWYTGGSFVTSYPEPRSVYIAQQFDVDREGTIGAELAGQGFWMCIQDSDVVEWITPPEEATSQ